MLTDFGCKHCGSNEVVKYGLEGGVQYWWCKKCQRKFADNDALPNMHTPIPQVSSALNMYYSGMSIDEIRQHLDQEHNNKPSDSTIYEWIKRFSIEATEATNTYKPNVGDVWLADETVIDLDGKKAWFWDILDTKTRFLLASQLTYNRTSQHAKELLEQAVRRAGKQPRVLITDKLGAYVEGAEMALGGDTQHIQTKGFIVQPNTNMIERFHGSLKSRTKVMRGLKTPEGAVMILDGWLVYYNFFRPHEALNDKTPAEKAGIKSTMHNWRDVVLQSRGNNLNYDTGELIATLPDFKRFYHQQVDIGTPTRYGLTKKKKRKGVIKAKIKRAPVIEVKRMPMITAISINRRKSR